MRFWAVFAIEIVLKVLVCYDVFYDECKGYLLMIYYDQLPLSRDILDALSKLKIDYVFQPIFYPDGKRVFSWEALMRPQEMTVTELIDQYMKEDKLHILEVATFFGAMQAYQLRGYTERVSINSFPSEAFTDGEGLVFDQFYGDTKGSMIVEMLEYPSLSISKWLQKKEACKRMNTFVSLDDYGSGINDMGKVDFIDPDIVKLDRSLISDIDRSTEKQNIVIDAVNVLHSKSKMIVAEGIETKEEFDYLVSLGIDYFQGYYLARPS